MRDLEECLGEDHHKIQKWIANGWLRDTLQGTNRHNGNGHDLQRFREDDFLEFIKRHPMGISLGKVDQTWVLGIMLLRGAELHENHLQSQASFEGGDGGVVTQRNGQHFKPTDIAAGRISLRPRNDLGEDGYILKELGGGDYEVRLRRSGATQMVLKGH
jgi:hypothetical protein